MDYLDNCIDEINLKEMIGTYVVSDKFKKVMEEIDQIQYTSRKHSSQREYKNKKVYITCLQNYRYVYNKKIAIHNNQGGSCFEFHRKYQRVEFY